MVSFFFFFLMGAGRVKTSRDPSVTQQVGTYLRHRE